MLALSSLRLTGILAALAWLFNWRHAGVGGYVPSEEEEEENRRKTMERLNAYRRSVGVDRKLEDEHKEEIEEALRQHAEWVSKTRSQKAIEVLSSPASC